MKFVLASSSPRRKDILTEYKYKFDIDVIDTDESIDDAKSPIENVKRIGLNKALVVSEKYEDTLILGCDTIVVLDGLIYGKPKDEADAYRILKKLSGKTHEVISGVGIVFNKDIINVAVISKVTFKDLSDEDIYSYINTKEPFGKAGAYAIQGLGSNLILKYEGSLNNIIGLPIEDIKEYIDKYYYMWKIGNVYIPNKLVLAPMAGITNEAFRVLCKEYGCGLLVAEMVSDKALGFGNEKTITMTKVHSKEHPISMQIFGADKDSMVLAAKWIDENSDCDIIDINMGCPVNKVAKKAMAGSNLLRDPNKVYEITKAVCDAVKKPVTVKIRLGWDEHSINALENAKMIEKAGAKAIAIHGRTRSQFYSGEANYDVIKQVKEALNIPVIANGDITDPKKAMEVLEYTGCDAVMIGRAAQGNPFIFKEINEYMLNGRIIERPSNKVIYDTIMKHYNYLVKLKGTHLACLEMRTHISAYLRGLPGSASIRNKVNMERDFNNVCEILKSYLLEVADEKEDSDFN